MNIKSAKYITSSVTNQNGSILVIFEDDTYASVPLDPANTDYQEILEWAKIDGNTIEDAD